MSVKKEELKRNELATILDEKLEAIKPYSNLILLGGLAIVVVIIGVVWYVNRNYAETAEMWEKFYSARNVAVVQADTEDLEAHAKDYGGELSALWALQLTADQKLGEGSRALYTDREEGKKDIEESIELYDQILESAEDKSLIRYSALLGRGQAYEALLDIDSARENYQEIVEQAGDESAIGKAVSRRIAMLEVMNQPGYRGFKTAFTSFDPTSSTPTAPPITLNTGPLPPIPNLGYPTTFDLNQGSNEGLVEPGGGEGDTNELPELNNPNGEGNTGDDTTGGDTTGGDTTGGDTTGGDTTGGDTTGGDDTGNDVP